MSELAVRQKSTLGNVRLIVARACQDAIRALPSIPGIPTWATWISIVLLCAGLGVAGAILGISVLALLAGIAIAIPLGIALVQRPQRGTLLLVAIVPFDGLLQVLPLPASTRSYKEAIVVATLMATLLAPNAAKAVRIAPEDRRYPSWVPAVVGLLIVGLVSAAQVSSTQAVTGFRIDFFYLLFAVAIWRCPLGLKDRDRLVTILMVTGVITAFLGIAEEIVGAGRLNALGFQYNSTIRFTGSHLRAFSTFANPFPFAFFLMIVTLISMPAALSDIKRTRNRLFLASMPIVAIALLFTFVRGAWLGLAVGWLFLAWRRNRILLLVVPLIAVAFLYLPGSITSSSVSSSSLSERSAGWSQNFDQVISHPFGIGIGATGAAASVVSALEANGNGNVVNTSVPGTATYQPDNYYYKTIYELGILGLWMFVLLLAAAFSATLKVSRTSGGVEGTFSLGVSACVLGAATASLVATYFEIFPMDLLFWTLLAVATTGLPSGERPSDSVSDSALYRLSPIH